ncbi:helix-turn-helix domain-containing protein [Legionella spiritensis]|uniref:Phage repressor n=1 Tax=Legionella spiritensis TaxID=452 RepID=A0A0W0Z8C4_LEGSP|nr:XRE family transcriptional regulator [Legionella spiritensis]KTD65356.1 phage repressor [Legionella spiritensis]SNV47319.1 phage repressor [Legionella spiritensis]
MSIKEKIGQRIREERNKKGLTRKALAALTENLNISRINNYERGERTPGPEEIKQLATALEISPAFLMCLSDDRQGKPGKTPGLGALIPVLDCKQACDPAFHIQAMKHEDYSEKVSFIPVSSEISELISEHAFALVVKDESMVPELKIRDVLVIDPETFPYPGNLVAAKLETNSEVIIRKYKQLSASKNSPEYELLALNPDWANIQDSNKIIGTVISLSRVMKY